MSTNADVSKIGVPYFDMHNNVVITAVDAFHCLSDLRGFWSVGPDGIAGTSLLSLGQSWRAHSGVCSPARLMKVFFLPCL